MTNVPAPGLAAYTIDITYDHNVPQAFQCDASMSSGVCNLSFGLDTVRITAGIDPARSGNFTLARIRFRCPWEGTSPLTLSVSVFADGQGNAQAVATIDGSITCSTTLPPTVTGTPTATAEKPLGDVDDDGSVTAVDALLILQFDADLLDHLSNAPSADVNENGVVNSVDAALILQYTANLLHQLPPPSFP